MWSVAQAALNLAYTPPPFEIATRVPFTLNTMFVVMMYSPGIPILFLVAAVSLTTSYWVDKYARTFLWGVEFLHAPCFGRLCTHTDRPLTCAARGTVVDQFFACTAGRPASTTVCQRSHRS